MKMKKTLSIILIATLILGGCFALVACNKDSGAELFSSGMTIEQIKEATSNITGFYCETTEYAYDDEGNMTSSYVRKLAVAPNGYYTETVRREYPNDGTSEPTTSIVKKFVIYTDGKCYQGDYDQDADEWVVYYGEGELDVDAPAIFLRSFNEILNMYDEEVDTLTLTKTSIEIKMDDEDYKLTFVANQFNAAKLTGIPSNYKSIAVLAE